MQSADRTAGEARELRAVEGWTALVRAARADEVVNRILAGAAAELPWFKTDLILRNVQIRDEYTRLTKDVVGRQSRD